MIRMPPFAHISCRGKHHARIESSPIHVYMQSSGSAARASKYSGDKENVPGSGNAVDKRTPHFAPLPPSGGGENFSDRSRGPGESDEDASQSQKPSQEGDENQGNKKMSRAAKSLMSKHLRRKSLASMLPVDLLLSCMHTKLFHYHFRAY